MAEFKTAREFLSSVWDEKMAVQRCVWDVNLLQERCEQITACMEQPRSGGADPHRDGTMTALADKREELLEREKQLERREKEAEAFLDRIGDARQRAILRLRYVEQLRWTEVQKNLERMRFYYSERQVYNLHRQAVQTAERQFLEDRDLPRGA